MSIAARLKTHLVDFITRVSTWVVIASLMITAFSAFPSWPSALLHAANIPILALALCLAKHGK